MIDSDKIVKVLNSKGPALPATVAKELGSNIMIASAILSEAVSRKKVKVSDLKVGSSPLYYLPGQEIRLMQWADQLDEKDRRTYDLLKERKVIREAEADPLTRVSLGKLKDFAIPLQVTAGENKEIFFKWYLTSNDEASLHISRALETSKQFSTPPQPEDITLKTAAPNIQSQATQGVSPKETLANPSQPQSQQTTEQPSENKLSDSKKQETDAPPTLASQPQPLQREPLREEPPTPPAEPSISEPQPPPQPQPNKELKKPSSEKISPPQQLSSQQTPEEQPTQKKQEKKTTQTNLQKEQPKQETGEAKSYFEDIEDELFESISNLFEEKTIKIVEAEIVRKGREINLTVLIPSVVGQLRYFAKVLHKKRASDKDVSSAFLEGEMKKLPLLFLYTGDVTKKAQAMSERHDFRNLMLLKIDHGS